MNQSKRVNGERRMMDCPNCAETIIATATSCRYCGNDVQRGGMNPTLIGGVAGGILTACFWLFVVFVGLPAVTLAVFSMMQ